jgi:hydroxymethylpyrimidine pyrophosphatase-like HAD family hydrolase
MMAIAPRNSISKVTVPMPGPIRLISTDFDGTIVSRTSEPALDRDCMELIRRLQGEGTVWAMNTGRSVDLLQTGLEDFGFPIYPDFILTSERDVHRPAANGRRWEPFGDWNERCAREHAILFSSAASILKDVIHFVNSDTDARILYESHGPAGLITASEKEMDRVVEFINAAKAHQPQFNFQRNTVYLRFCHADYHKGAVLGELARLLEIERAGIFAAGDHHNDISMLDGKFAALTACPANAIPEVKAAVRKSRGYVATKDHGAGVHEALEFFLAS